MLYVPRRASHLETALSTIAVEINPESSAFGSMEYSGPQFKSPPAEIAMAAASRTFEVKWYAVAIDVIVSQSLIT